ncbi:hypothetical protein MJO28_002587 [Puccinia striiformis f. sp. tritici]|uniref:Uncharacterized protein n=1 Tax=Puccinia striiformis f. sp. tritici TaxID=168172 RepID=A0ACC0EQ43_9BASI|nr:hypothetical protein MJO28_002587 [Puccinia striiformis f. sp. tritici]
MKTNHRRDPLVTFSRPVPRTSRNPIRITRKAFGASNIARCDSTLQLITILVESGKTFLAPIPRRVSTEVNAQFSLDKKASKRNTFTRSNLASPYLDQDRSFLGGYPGCSRARKGLQHRDSTLLFVLAQTVA